MHDFSHGGDIRHLRSVAGPDVIDFSANINPVGLPAWTWEAMESSLSDVVHYPDPYCQKLCLKAGDYFGVNPAEIVAGNGSTDLLYALVRAFKINRALVAVPAYTDYRRACEVTNVEVIPFFLSEANNFVLDFSKFESFLSKHAGPDVAVFLGQPSNPVGSCFDPVRFTELAMAYKQVQFIVDEAFADFVPEITRLCTARPDNVTVLYSLTKFYAIPGLRLGLCFSSVHNADLIRRELVPWSVNSIAQEFGRRALGDEKYKKRTLLTIKQLRDELFVRLSSFSGLKIYPGQANFLLCKLAASGPDGFKLAEKLIDYGIAIRVCASFEGLDSHYVRFAVRTRAENEKLLTALQHIFSTSNRQTR